MRDTGAGVGSMASSSGKDSAAQLSKDSYKVTKDRLKPVWDLLQSGKPPDCKEPETVYSAPRLKTVMRAFQPNVTVKETKWIMDNNESMTFGELYDLVKDSQEADFDPIEEAFNMVQKNGPDGYVDLDMVATFFEEGLGMEGVSLPIIREVARKVLEDKGEGTTHDHKRGRIDRKMFRRLCDLRPELEEEREAEELARQNAARGAAQPDAVGGVFSLALGGLGEFTNQLQAANDKVLGAMDKLDDQLDAAIARA